ncbi:MAG: PIG-L family deacetylase, partial [Anaerolineae bacterium]|nr:PIG-L family deacetylase [Anaerolineae bacterium]
MLKLKLDADKEDPLKILLLGAHSDDIEIGLGGTILRLADEYPNLAVTWVVFSATGDRAVEARKSAEDFLQGVPNKQIFLKEFKDGYFPSRVADIKDVFEELKKSLSPDVIFTHYRNDLHQDHRQLNELTWNTWREHYIQEYEITKYDGELGNPNYFVAYDDA